MGAGDGVVRRGYLGLGSNIGDTRAHLRPAVSALVAEGVTVLASSSTYQTEPVGLILDQADFLNACLSVETSLGPEELLSACKAAERTVGRAAGGPRHGPRVIDVDLLLLGDLVYSSDRLTLPHAEVSSRRFVLVPLLELAPELALPSGEPLADEARRAARRPGGTPRRAAIGVMARCSWSSTSATPRPISASTPTARTRSPSTGVLPPCASPPGTSSARRSPTCSPCAGWASPTSTARSSPPRSRSCRGVDRDGRRYLGHEMLVVGTAIRTGMPIRMDNPREVGADRLVNSVAAYERVRRRLHRRGLRHRDHLRRRLGARRVSGRDHHPRRGDLHRRSVRAGGQAAQGRAGAAAQPDRQVDRRGDPRRASSSASPARSTGSSPGCARSSAPTRPCWPPAGWRACSCPRCGPHRRRGRPADVDRAAADLGAQRALTSAWAWPRLQGAGYRPDLRPRLGGPARRQSLCHQTRRRRAWVPVRRLNRPRVDLTSESTVSAT